MASTIEELEETIQKAISPGFRGRLLDRGIARSMIWTNGLLPDGAPGFSPDLSYDLLSYGYSLLNIAIRLKELGGDSQLCRAAFEKAGSAISDVIHNGNPNDLEGGFHNVLAAASYHLARYSAKAFSLLNHNIQSGNISIIEKSLCLLMLRELDQLERFILEWKQNTDRTDSGLATRLDVLADKIVQDIDAGEDIGDYGAASVELSTVDLAITDNFQSAIFAFLFSLEHGNEQFLEHANSRLKNSLEICSELNFLPQWWAHRIAIHLLNDLWDSSFHKVIPPTPLDDNTQNWTELRWKFIASLYKRKKSEIDLWPSQFEGAQRAVNDLDDLVISLPTSAGKTRIAELCILRCLSTSKRVLFITPLRALSAQTEVSLRKTFLPLGKTVSTLYGSIGTSNYEQDVLRSNDIVVGTPEKLDFALRNDPTLIDDIGLIILDEGHMIGLNEREIKYEVQIQRLLKRADADSRRIVCLSAILPEGDQFDDFVSWLRRDKEGKAIQCDWRPTDLRFGEIVWGGNSGSLNFTIGNEKPFIPKFILPFIPSQPNPGIRTVAFPKDVQELSLAAAWRLTQDGHTVLIYCPQRSSVDSFAKTIIDLHKRGALNSVLSIPEEKIRLAKILGREWLGNNHPIVECLNIGVVIHHGALPTPFRKEVEKLLRNGALKITVSSPTLAQGLNLAATAVIFHSLYRNGDKIKPAEFKNVAGRAGRAFVDIHGIVLHPIFDKHNRRIAEWRKLVKNTKSRDMESGLFLLVMSLVSRIARNLQENTFSGLLEYVLNNALTWKFSEVASENENEVTEQKEVWEDNLAALDTAILSLLGDEEISIIDIPDALDSILQSSLWQRRLDRHNEVIRQLFNTVIEQRAKFIWNSTTTLQRKGYFLAGVGLKTGQRLDSISQHANQLLVRANDYISVNDQQSAITVIIDLAELIFDIPPFIPNILPDDWKNILKIWLEGQSLNEPHINNIDDALKFIEDGLVYRLPWGLEAIRVRATANGDEIEPEMTIDSFETGLVVPAVENGTLNRSAAMLMQAGFNSRLAAIHAIQSTNASFTNRHQFKKWLESELVVQLTASQTWPTLETSSLWIAFISEYQPSSQTTWEFKKTSVLVDWFSHDIPISGSIVKVVNATEGVTTVVGNDGESLGILHNHLNLLQNGTYSGYVSDITDFLDITYLGPGSTPFEYLTSP